MWDRLKLWFKDSETILWARLQVFLGIVLSVLASMDWSPLFSAGIPTRQQYYFSGVLVVQGIVTEYMRRRRTRLDDEGRLVPKVDPDA